MTKAFRGSFNPTRSGMLAHCIDSLLDRNPNVGADEVEDVVVGAATHAGEQDGNIARLAVILSKLPVTAAGVASTVLFFRFASDCDCGEPNCFWPD